MTTIYIIRHAEADGNIYRRIHGQYDGWVTENGYAQLERLRERFLGEKIDSVYSSDLFRAVMTAEAISRERGLAVIQKPELREVNLGDWEDRPWGEIALSEPETLYNFNNRPWLWHVPNAEDADTVANRMCRAFWEIVAENPERTVAICSHGMAIRFLLCRLLGKPLQQIGDISHCDNTGVSLINASDGNIEAVFLNDNSHLGDLSTLAKQKWWRKKSDASDGNTWFSPVDFNTQAGLLRDIFSSHPGYYMHLGLTSEELLLDAKRRSEHDERAVVFAHTGDTLVGTAVLDLENIAGDAGRILFLYLGEPFRKSGYGVQLIGYAVSIYRAMNKKFAELEIHSANTEGIEFFGRYGFKEDSRRQVQGGEILLMRKIIDYYRH